MRIIVTEDYNAMSRHQVIVLWCLVAPMLLFEKMDLPWYSRILLVILSPFTAGLLFFLSIFVSVLTTPTMTCFPVDHQLSGAEDISALTHSFIPPCDTIGAFYQTVGIDGTGFENFYMQHPLTAREREKLQQACRNDSLWEETEKEFTYSRFSTEEYRHNPDNRLRYDKVVVRVPKATRHIKVEFIHY